MFHDDIMSIKFKLSSIAWTLGLTASYINCSISTNLHIIHWELSILIYLIISWFCIIYYIFLMFQTSPSPTKLILTKLVFLISSGPYLLSISCYAYYTNKSMHARYYITSFFIWWLYFSVSVYCTFKLTLHLTIFYQRKAMKKRLLEHFRNIDMHSYSFASK